MEESDVFDPRMRNDMHIEIQYFDEETKSDKLDEEIFEEPLKSENIGETKRKSGIRKIASFEIEE